MQYLLALYSDETAWEKMTPEQQEQGGAAYMAYTQALQAAGVYRGSNRLRPTGSGNFSPRAMGDGSAPRTTAIEHGRGPA